MAEIILNEPRIRALIGKGEAASVAQHVGMGEQEQGSGGAVFPQKEIDGRAVQRLALFGSRRTAISTCSSLLRACNGLRCSAHEERLAGRLHPGAFLHPCGNRPQLVAA